MSGQFNSSSLIAGPAVIRFPGSPVVDVITEGDIQEKIVRETWSPRNSLHGEFDTRLKGQHVELSFAPAGDLVGLNKCGIPTYGPSDIGKSIMQSTGITIATVGGEQIAYSRWALTKPSTIRLGASVTLLGDCTIACLHKNNSTLIAADALNAVTTAALTTNYAGNYDPVTRRWTAAFGTVTMSIEGSVEISIVPEVEIKSVDAFGPVDIYLKSLRVTAKFKPVNLTEADVYSLLAVQGANAILPGESLAKAGNSLVITELAAATPKSATLFAAGIDTGGLAYGDVTNRNGEMTFITRHRFTGAAPQALWAFSL